MTEWPSSDHRYMAQSQLKALRAVGFSGLWLGGWGLIGVSGCVIVGSLLDARPVEGIFVQLMSVAGLTVMVGFAMLILDLSGPKASLAQDAETQDAETEGVEESVMAEVLKSDTGEVEDPETDEVEDSETDEVEDAETDEVHDADTDEFQEVDGHKSS